MDSLRSPRRQDNGRSPTGTGRYSRRRGGYPTPTVRYPTPNLDHTGFDLPLPPDTGAIAIYNNTSPENTVNGVKATMTTERWNDEKLDRLADLVGSIGLEVKDLTRQVTDLTGRVTDLTGQVTGLTGQVTGLTKKLDETANIANGNARVIQALADSMAEAAAERREILRVIAQQQSEVRGLQTENQRMWEMLTNRRNQDDNPDT